VFERFLARVQRLVGDAVVLEGGLVLELRLQRARTTKDVELRMIGTPAELLDRLQEAGRLDLFDFLRFEIQRDRQHPEIRGEAMKCAGHRFAAECRPAGKIYGRRFGVDISFGDPAVGEPDEIVGDRLLDFAGIEPARLRLYPIVSHIAEKLHAYSMPCERPDSRIKDLPDLALLASAGDLDAGQLRTALETTFAFRGTHALPAAVPRPPEHWTVPYAAMAEADELHWRSIEALHEAVHTFLGPVLAVRAANGRWSAGNWRWNQDS
jgi:hypothetical protein